MKRRISFIILNCLLAFTLHAEVLSGKWNFEAPTAPYGFQNGSIEFKNVDNKTIAVVDFGNASYELDVKQTKENQYTSIIPIMGDEVNVTVDNSDGKMKTIVNALGMDIDVKLSKTNE